MDRPRAALAMLALPMLAFAATAPLSTVSAEARMLCSGLRAMLPTAAMLMVVAGAAIYAAGQIMGAETRARANVWAAAALTGAVFSVLIWTVAPPVLAIIYTGRYFETQTIANAVCGSA